MIIHIGTLSGLPPGARTVLFLGTPGSDHLRELVRIAEFKGRVAHRIQQAADLDPQWFAGVGEVGIVLGASNLEPILRAVIERLQNLGAAEAEGTCEGTVDLASGRGEAVK